MQDVGEQQFLMLLLVMQADFENGKHARRIRRGTVVDQPLDRGIDMRAIGCDVVGGRPRDQPALWAARGAGRRRRNRN